MHISALIPYKPDNEIRDYLWGIVQKWYHQYLPDIELCLGVDESDPFCRSRAINQAGREASGSVFLIVDTDVVYEPGLIGRILRLIPEHPWIIPFYNGLKLTPTATERFILQGLTGMGHLLPEDIEENIGYAGSFINVVTRDWFERIGGMDERFQGWGGEDGALVYSLDTLCGPLHRMNETIYHLWHPKAVRVNRFYEANMSLLGQYRDAMGNISTMINLLLGKATTEPTRQDLAEKLKIFL